MKLYRVWISSTWRGFFSLFSTIIGQLIQFEGYHCSIPTCGCPNCGKYPKINKEEFDGVVIDLRDDKNPYLENNLTFPNPPTEIQTQLLKKLHSIEGNSSLNSEEVRLQKGFIMPENMMDYYFVPLSDKCKFSFDESDTIINSHGHHCWYHRNPNDKELIMNILKKYFYFNYEILSKVKDIQENLKGKILGVHVRCTDKYMETKMFDVECYVDATKKLLSENNFDMIFLSCDNVEASVAFKEAFGEKVYMLDIFRISNSETNPVFQSCFNTPNETPKNKGLFVILDCLLLSGCNALLRGKSTNVSDFAYIFKDGEYDFVKYIDEF